MKSSKQTVGANGCNRITSEPLNGKEESRSGNRINKNEQRAGERKRNYNPIMDQSAKEQLQSNKPVVQIPVRQNQKKKIKKKKENAC